MNAWLLVGGCAIVSAFAKASGPLLVGARELPAWALRVTVLLAPAVLTGMVVTSTLAGPDGLDADAAAFGVMGAVVVVCVRGSALLAVLVAVAITAGARAL